MALDAVILDLDGTLVDTNVLHAKAWERAMREFDYRLDVERIITAIGKSGSRLVPDLLGPRAEERHGDAMRDAHDQIYLELIEEEPVRLFHGAEEFFKQTRHAGLRTVVATGSKRESLEKVAALAGLNLVDLADEIVADDDVEVGKPSPDPVIAAYRKLDLSPAQCVMVGDTPYDVESARRAGVICLGVLTGVHSSDALLRAGARGVYDDIERLGDDLEEALAKSTPGPIRLTWGVMRELMGEALGEARESLRNDDLPVGAILVNGEGAVVGRGRSRTETSRNFLAHAEMEAFTDVSKGYPLNRRELILVSTLEPCMMCFGAAMGARVDTIVYALDAPSNGGIARCRPMQSPGMIMPRVVGHICADESRTLFEEWFSRHPDGPFVKDLLERNTAETSGTGC